MAQFTKDADTHTHTHTHTPLTARRATRLKYKQPFVTLSEVTFVCLNLHLRLRGHEGEQINTPTCTDSFAVAALDPVFYAPLQYVAEILHR